MQRIFSTIGQAFRQSIFSLCLMSLIILSSLFIFSSQPSLAASFTNTQPTLQKGVNKTGMNSQAVENREQAYEKAVKAGESAQDLEKTYEDNLKSYRKENPEPGLIEEAKNVIKEVTQKN